MKPELDIKMPVGDLKVEKMRSSLNESKESLLGKVESFQQNSFNTEARTARFFY